MNKFENLKDQYFSQLRNRATKLVRAKRKGTVGELAPNMDHDLGSANQWLDENVSKQSAKSIGVAIFVVLGFLVLAFIVGVASKVFWLGLFVFALGCGIAAKALPKLPNFDEVKTRGRQYYLSHVQKGMDAWGAEIRERQRREREEAEEKARRAEAEVEAILAPARESMQRWQELHPHPAPQPYGVSPAGAENWLCDWMIHMGAEGATTTQYVSDGGIDIEAEHYVAQVKHYTGSVGVNEIREHIGVAAVDPHQRQPLFFTSGNYSSGGIETANRAGMSLFIYSVEGGMVEAVNSHADLLLRAGLNPVWLETDA